MTSSVPSNRKAQILADPFADGILALLPRLRRFASGLARGSGEADDLCQITIERALRNRDKWQHYSDAVGDMVDRTSSEIAAWTLVEANDKRFARVKVLRTINEALEAAYARD